MSDKCRAVVFNGDGTFTIESFDKPTPPDGGAVLKVEAVGMCSSDVAQLNGHQHVPGEASPVVAGHEMVGRVDQLAHNADLGVSIGDRVVIDLLVPGPPNDKMIVYGYTMGLDEGSGLWGGYGEYMSILAGTRLMKLTESLPATHLTIFEPLANAVNWVEQAGVTEGQTVVIQGPGHVGLMCVAAVKIAGASTIIAVDPVSLKRELAQGMMGIFGFSGAAGSGDSLYEEIRNMAQAHDKVLEGLDLQPNGIPLTFRKEFDYEH